MEILKVNNVKKYFSGQRAVDDISFSINKGDIFGLLGPNGAGKTTLIRMITGIFFPDAGEIFFENKTFDPQSQAISIGYMPEERGLYKKMKIGEQAVYLARLRGLSKTDAEQKVREWFVKFGMESWWGKKVEDLSKGMGQKLQFVTTVVHNPSLIILDEPFSGLDPVNSNLIKDEIFNLAKGGATIIFSTHRMEQVEEICDHIMLVNKGKKILDSTVAEAKQSFKENIFEVETEAVHPLNNSSNYSVIESIGNQHRLKIPEAISTNTVLTELINEGIVVKKFAERLPSLNDIFIKLVHDTPTARNFSILNN